ncbi:MAG: hypothetical protein JXQ82_01125 [Methanomicrobiaceae archaeon]|nr:hypothetical protein [Methanomicrobiaceae archaeon]
MRKLFFISLMLAFIALAFVAGCVDSGSTAPSETQAATVSPTTEQVVSTADMVPGPTQQPPAKYLVDVQVDKDIVYGTITAAFRGGLGQNFVSDITVDVYYPDGTHETKQLSAASVGDNVEFAGHKDKKDRVKVTVTYDGSLGTYVISDQLVPEKLPTTLS